MSTMVQIIPGAADVQWVEQGLVPLKDSAVKLTYVNKQVLSVTEELQDYWGGGNTHSLWSQLPKGTNEIFICGSQPGNDLVCF